MIRNWGGLVLVGILVVAGAVGAACGGDSPGGSQAAGDDASTGDDQGSLLGGEAGAPVLDVEPKNQTMVVTSPGQTLQFMAYASGSSAPVQAQWTADVASIGTIDDNGLFSATGLVGGQVTIEALAGTLHGQTSMTVVLQIQETRATSRRARRGSSRAGAPPTPASPGSTPTTGRCSRAACCHPRSS